MDKNQDNTECSDMAYTLFEETAEFIEVFGGELTCRFIEEELNITNCLDAQELAPYQDTKSTQGTTFSEACCRCGGGIPSASLPDTLLSWKLVVYGHTEPAADANDALLSTPCNDSCDPDLEFCGTDDNCHAFSCKEFYRFGPLELTNYNPDSPANLACDDFDGASNNANAVIFGCESYLPFGQTFPTDSLGFYFDRRCNANMPGGLQFVCYDIKESTTFNDYVAEVESFQSTTCDGGSPQSILRGLVVT